MATGMRIEQRASYLRCWCAKNDFAENSCTRANASHRSWLAIESLRNVNRRSPRLKKAGFLILEASLSFALGQPGEIRSISSKRSRFRPGKLGNGN
jgi:hypothetical protein